MEPLVPFKTEIETIIKKINPYNLKRSEKWPIKSATHFVALFVATDCTGKSRLMSTKSDVFFFQKPTYKSKLN